MTNRPLISRRAAARLARLGAAGSAVMLAVTIVNLGGEAPASAAGTSQGAAVIATPIVGGADPGGHPITSGDSATQFTLVLPTSAACAGDTANDGWVVTSFMVPASVDVAGLQFDPVTGPNPQGVGSDFRQPLYEGPDGGGSAYTSRATAPATNPPGPGPIVNIPAFDLSTAGFQPGNIPAGSYKLGIACTKGGPSATQLGNFWTAQIDVAAASAGAGGPAQITFTVPTSTTTTVGSGSTSTTAPGGSTSTTDPGGSTTTTAGSGSTTTTAGGSSTSSTSGAGTTGGTGGGGHLPTSGSSAASTVTWALILVICGRLAVVLSRPPRVKPPHA